MTEDKKFAGLVERLLKVPHDEIKEKLRKEKAARKQKKSKSSSASREKVGP